MRVFLAFGFAFLIGMLVVFWQPARTPVVSDDPDLTLPAFAGCAADTDCKLVALPCGQMGAANAAQHKFVFNWYQQKIRHSTCPPTPAGQGYHARCMNSLCTAVPNETEQPHVP